MNNRQSTWRRVVVCAFGAACIFPLLLPAQPNPDFSVNLQVDYSSAEQIIDLCEGRIHNVDAVADLRGSQLAAATSMVLARRELAPEAFKKELESLRDNFKSTDDVFGFGATRTHLPEIKALLAEYRKRQLDRRVIATIEQFFPSDARISTSIAVYIVAFGNENASAYVRRIAWIGNRPMFVGSGEGEPVIVVSLQRIVESNPSTEVQFIETLSTLAHETFHAVFAVYQSSSPVWKSIAARREPWWELAELVQNEGIAYHISLQQRTGASLPKHVFNEATQAVRVLNDAMEELLSPTLTTSRARELLMNANLSGSFEKNYGAAAGLLMAFAIDTKMGRNALTETVTNGVRDFFRKYDDLTNRYDELPKLSENVRKELVR